MPTMMFSPMMLALPHPLFSAHTHPWALHHGAPYGAWPSIDFLAPPRASWPSLDYLASPRASWPSLDYLAPRPTLMTLASRLADAVSRNPPLFWTSTDSEYTMRLRASALSNLTAEVDGDKLVLRHEHGVVEVEMPIAPYDPSASLTVEHDAAQELLVIRLVKDKDKGPIPIPIADVAPPPPESTAAAEKVTDEAEPKTRDEAAKVEEAALNDKFNVQAEGSSGETDVETESADPEAPVAAEM